MKTNIESDIPNYQDYVRHKTSDISVTGTVIAKYLADDSDRLPPYSKRKHQKDPIKWLLDVRRSDDDIIEYATPAENWERIMTEEERF